MSPSHSTYTLKQADLSPYSWDQTYATDLTTHASTPSHAGHAWFSDVNASHKVLKYLTSSALALDRETTSFLDLGTGNGEMLFLLREEGGFSNKLIGVDYSKLSVELCKKLAQQKGLVLGPSLDGRNSMEFTLWDILHSKPRPEWVEGFDVVLDKGTFDAVSLSGEVDELQRRVFEGYARRVVGLVKEGGMVVVTSCNWTEEELKTWFCGEESILEVYGRVEYPVLKFGGQTGQSVCSVCFKKKS